MEGRAAVNLMSEGERSNYLGISRFCKRQLLVSLFLFHAGSLSFEGPVWWDSWTIVWVLLVYKNKCSYWVYKNKYSYFLGPSKGGQHSLFWSWNIHSWLQGHGVGCCHQGGKEPLQTWRVGSSKRQKWGHFSQPFPQRAGAPQHFEELGRFQLLPCLAGWLWLLTQRKTTAGICTGRVLEVMITYKQLSTFQLHWRNLNRVKFLPVLFFLLLPTKQTINSVNVTAERCHECAGNSEKARHSRKKKLYLEALIILGF